MTDLSRLTQSLAGRYVVERELGSGGMATVYLARDVKHDRAVALKVLREELSASLGKERFLREIKVAAGEYWIVDADARMVERWRPGDNEPEVLLTNLRWQPVAEHDALAIDLTAYFRVVHGENT